MRVWAGVFFLVGVSLALAGCGGGTSSSISGVPPTLQSTHHEPSGTSPITHVVLIVQENRSFNDFFATFPGGDGTSREGRQRERLHAADRQRQDPAREGAVAGPQRPRPSIRGVPNVVRQGQNGRLRQGAVRQRRSRSARYPYQYTDPADIRPIGSWRSSIRSPSTCSPRRAATASPPTKNLIAGDTVVERRRSDDRSSDLLGTKCYWGCDAPKGTHTALITRERRSIERGKFPVPSALSYPDDARSARCRRRLVEVLRAADVLRVTVSS